MNYSYLECNECHQDIAVPYSIYIIPLERRTAKTVPSSARVSAPREELGLVRTTRKPAQVREEKTVDPNISRLFKKKLKLSPTPQKPSSSQRQKQSETSSRDVQHKKQEEDPLKLHIWDFAGHELYYTTHQVMCISNS